MDNSGKSWADEHVIGVAKGVDKDIVDGLKMNFAGECTEIGMYLAMSRQADREGYPTRVRPFLLLNPQVASEIFQRF